MACLFYHRPGYPHADSEALYAAPVAEVSEPVEEVKPKKGKKPEEIVPEVVEPTVPEAQ